MTRPDGYTGEVEVDGGRSTLVEVERLGDDIELTVHRRHTTGPLAHCLVVSGAEAEHLLLGLVTLLVRP